MKIYHYTKGISMNSIFTDGFIAIEGKRGLNRTPTLTECVWLTEKTQFPKTALPFVYLMPETNLAMHINQNIHVDLDKLSSFVEGVYRFSFDSCDTRFEKWHFSKTRKKFENNVEWRRMESIANKVGDECRSFWISNNDVQLTNFSLETFENGHWMPLLNNCTLSSANNIEKDVIKKIQGMNSIEDNVIPLRKMLSDLMLN